MSFLFDPPALVLIGASAKANVPDAKVRRWLRRGTVATFVGVSVALYLDLPITRPLWTAVRASSGRDWMLNSGVFSFEHREPPPTTHLAAASLFATYPLWYRLGEHLVSRPLAG